MDNVYIVQDFKNLIKKKRNVRYLKIEFKLQKDHKKIK